MAHHGRAKRSTRCSAIDCSVGTNANQPASPTAVPTTAAVAPTAAPLASMTSRTWRSVAPSEPSMPRARRRRWAITVNPATAIRPTKSSPRRAQHQDDGLGRGLAGGPAAACDADAGAAAEGGTTAGSAGWRRGGSRRLAGGLAWPGATSANWSSRFERVLDQPDDLQCPAVLRSRRCRRAGRRSWPRRWSPRPRRDRSGSARSRGATSPGRTGPSGSGPAGRWWTPSPAPGWSGGRPRRRCRTGCWRAAMSAARLGSEPGRVTMVLAVPNVGSAFRLDGVGRHAQPDGGGGHGHHEQRQHQGLVAPLAAEQPPRPADHRPPGRGAARRRPARRRRAAPNRGGHGFGWGRGATPGRRGARSDRRRGRPAGTPPGRPTTPAGRRGSRPRRRRPAGRRPGSGASPPRR